MQHVLLPAACAVLGLLRQMACRQNDSCLTVGMQTIVLSPVGMLLVMGVVEAWESCDGHPSLRASMLQRFFNQLFQVHERRDPEPAF